MSGIGRRLFGLRIALQRKFDPIRAIVRHANSHIVTQVTHSLDRTILLALKILCLILTKCKIWVCYIFGFYYNLSQQSYNSKFEMKLAICRLHVKFWIFRSSKAIE